MLSNPLDAVTPTPKKRGKMLKTTEQKIAKLEAELAALKAEIAASKQPAAKESWLKDGVKYWYIVDYNVQQSAWKHNIDRFRLSMDNVFRTRENAELWLEIHNRAVELRGDWEPDWSDKHKSKYYLFWDCEKGKPMKNGGVLCKNQGVFYMSSKAAETLISEYGERLKIWICGEEA